MIDRMWHCTCSTTAVAGAVGQGGGGLSQSGRAPPNEDSTLLPMHTIHSADCCSIEQGYTLNT